MGIFRSILKSAASAVLPPSSVGGTVAFVAGALTSMALAAIAKKEEEKEAVKASEEARKKAEAEANAQAVVRLEKEVRRLRDDLRDVHQQAASAAHRVEELYHLPTAQYDREVLKVEQLELQLAAAQRAAYAANARLESLWDKGDGPNKKKNGKDEDSSRWGAMHNQDPLDR